MNSMDRSSCCEDSFPIVLVSVGALFLLCFVCAPGLIGLGLLGGAIGFYVGDANARKEDIRLFNTAVDAWDNSSDFLNCQSYSDKAFSSTFGPLSQTHHESEIDWASFSEDPTVKNYSACYYSVSFEVPKVEYKLNKNLVFDPSISFEGGENFTENLTIVNLSYSTFVELGYWQTSGRRSSAAGRCLENNGGFYVDQPDKNCFHVLKLWQLCMLIDFQSGLPILDTLTGTPKSCLGEYASEMNSRVNGSARYDYIDTTSLGSLSEIVVEPFKVEIVLRSPLDPMLTMSRINEGRALPAQLDEFGDLSGVLFSWFEGLLILGSIFVCAEGSLFCVIFGIISLFACMGCHVGGCDDDCCDYLRSCWRKKPLWNGENEEMETLDDWDGGAADRIDVSTRVVGVPFS